MSRLPATPSGPDAPSIGDVVIVKEIAGTTFSYVLAIMPNPAQLRCHTLEEALDVASRWRSTCERALTIWISDDGETFTAVPAALVKPPSAAETRRVE